MTRPIRVLVVDDSALVRRILVTGLSKDPMIEVVGHASDPYRARDLLVDLAPDVLTLDIEMPRMDGLTFLRKLIGMFPIQTIVLSSLVGQDERFAAEAFAAGAVAVMRKPTTGIVDGLPLALDELCALIKASAKTSVAKERTSSPPARADRNVWVVREGESGASFDRGAHPLPVPRRPTSAFPHHLGSAHGVDAVADSANRIIALGASVGGVQALAQILPEFPPDSPPIVVAQHMPVGFTAPFAKRLDAVCRVRVQEAADGDRLLPGVCLIAPGGEKHLVAVRSGAEYRVRLVEGAAIHFSRPSVDVLFCSLAKVAGRNVAAAVLTGMGRDGAAGLAAIRAARGATFAQDEASSVVFGMAAAAIEAGAVSSVLPLRELPAALVSAARSDP